MAKRFKDGLMRCRNDAIVKEDYSKQCNLPTEVIQKMWPSAGDPDNGYVDTLFAGVQKQLHADNKMMRHIRKAAKY